MTVFLFARVGTWNNNFPPLIMLNAMASQIPLGRFVTNETADDAQTVVASIHHATRYQGRPIYLDGALGWGEVLAATTE